MRNYSSYRGKSETKWKDDRSRNGLSLKQQEELEKYLNEEVRSSAKEVMDYIEKTFGIKYSESGVLKLLKRLKYSYKKPVVVPSKVDPAKQTAFVKLYQEKEHRDSWLWLDQTGDNDGDFN